MVCSPKLSRNYETRKKVQRYLAIHVEVFKAGVLFMTEKLLMAETDKSCFTVVEKKYSTRIQECIDSFSV